MTNCPNGRWHYDDLSCCHAVIAHDDLAIMASDLDDIRDVVARMCMGRFTSDQEKELTLSRLDAVIALLPESSPVNKSTDSQGDLAERHER